MAAIHDRFPVGENPLRNLPPLSQRGTRPMFFGEGSSDESKCNPILGTERSAMGVLQKKHFKQEECAKATLWRSEELALSWEFSQIRRLIIRVTTPASPAKQAPSRPRTARQPH